MTDAASDELYSNVYHHLNEISQDPDHPLNIRLIQEADTFLAVRLWSEQDKQQKLVSILSAVLPQIQQDPEPLNKLLLRLIDPYSFSNVLTLDPPVDFVAGLDPGAEPFNNLMLSLLEKAATSPVDVARLANMYSVVHALVRLWLTTQHVGVADKSASVLLSLLKTDNEPPSRPSTPWQDSQNQGKHRPRGQGLMWRRFFGDKDIYAMILNVCSLDSSDMFQLGSGRRSLAQARLVDLVAKLAPLNWSYLVRSHHPQIEQTHGLDPQKDGFLDFVTQRMVQTREDVLVEMHLLRSFATLLTNVKEPSMNW